MGGILFLLAIGAIGLVFLWTIQSDQPGTAGGDKGLLAMKSGDEKTEHDVIGPAPPPPWQKPKASGRNRG